ncbi:sugar metabolism global transcriptional regulator Mlc [Plesiomonas shigelloides]|uniref:sugar metabolism global transcriptional regulator Mlc n=1 Tax=Plesiomonas shigelloides TaxID=703 RepID=UPI00387F28AF
MAEGHNPGHIDQIKQINAGAVYRLIDQLGPISRIELSKQANLAPASITKITRELLDAHLIKEDEFQEPGSRGRPAVGLILDTEGWHFLSARLGRGYLTLALHELSSELLIEERLDIIEREQSALLKRLVSEIDLFFTRHQDKLERLSAIAITLPGVIDATRGIVHQMPYYHVKDMPLAAELEQKTGLPVLLRHDVCAWTMAEALFGPSQGCQNVVQLSINHGVGVGVMIDGKLIHGQYRNLIEAGHIVVNPQGEQCECGHRGCLETEINIQALLRKARQRLESGEESVLRHQTLNVSNLCQAALNGDALALNLLTEAAERIGVLLSMLVNLFHPEKVLFGSPLSQAQPIMFPVIMRTLEANAYPLYTQNLTLEPTRFYNEGTMPGAGLVKESLYSGVLLTKLLEG